MTSDRISSFTANLVGRTIAYAIDDVERDRFPAPLRVATPRETHSRQLLFQVVSDLGERHSDTAEEVHPQLAGNDERPNQQLHGEPRWSNDRVRDRRCRARSLPRALASSDPSGNSLTSASLSSRQRSR